MGRPSETLRVNTEQAELQFTRGIALENFRDRFFSAILAIRVN